MDDATHFNRQITYLLQSTYNDDGAILCQRRPRTIHRSNQKAREVIRTLLGLFSLYPYAVYFIRVRYEDRPPASVARDFLHCAKKEMRKYWLSSTVLIEGMGAACKSTFCASCVASIRPGVQVSTEKYMFVSVC